MYISDMLLVSDMPDEARADMTNWVACLGGTEPKDVYLGRMRNAGFGDMEIIADKPWEGSATWASSVHSMNIKAYKPA